MLHKFSKYIVITLLVLNLNPAALSAEESSIWNSANDLYSQGKFSEALESYMSIESEGFVSESLFYNIANCHFKLGNFGKSILYYERALRLNPSHKDTKNNLRLVKEFTVDKIDDLPEFILKTWVREMNYKLSSDRWVAISIVLFIISLIFLMFFRFGSTHAFRKLSFFVSLFLALLFAVTTLFALNQRASYYSEEEAIVMVPVSTVRSSPDRSGNTLFILHEGTKVEFIEQLGSWKRIELSDGRQGWIELGDVEII